MGIAITTTPLVKKPRDTIHNTASCKRLNNNLLKRQERLAHLKMSQTSSTPARIQTSQRRRSSKLVKKMITVINHMDQLHAPISQDSQITSTLIHLTSRPNGLK